MVKEKEKDKKQDTPPGNEPDGAENESSDDEDTSSPDLEETSGKNVKVKALSEAGLEYNTRFGKFKFNDKGVATIPVEVFEELKRSGLKIQKA